MVRRLIGFGLVVTMLVVSSLPVGATAQESDTAPDAQPLLTGGLPSVSIPDSAIGPDGRPFPTGGTRIGNQVHYAAGAVVLEFAPAQDAVILRTRCPNDWFCLFEHRSWGGRMLRFRSCCSWQNLGNWGFTNAASSWDNRMRGNDVQVADGTTNSSRRYLWCANQRSSSSYVGNSRNDRADSIYIYPSANRC